MSSAKTKGKKANKKAKKDPNAIPEPKFSFDLEPRPKPQVDASAQKANIGVRLPPLLDGLPPEWEKHVNWSDMTYYMCQSMGIPDLDTKAGLKNVHHNFAHYARQLDNFFTHIQARDKKPHQVRGPALVAVTYSKMCADNVLLKRVLLETNFVRMVETLLFDPHCQHIVVGLLWRISCNCSFDMREELAVRTPKVLMDVIDRFPSDVKLSKLAVATLTETCLTLTHHDPLQTPARRSLLDTRRLIRLLVSVARKPGFMQLVAPYLSGASCMCYDDFVDIPEATDILISLIRCPQVRTRMCGLGGIQRLYIGYEEEDALGSNITPEVLVKLLQTVSSTNPDLHRELLVFGGYEKSEAYGVLRNMNATSEVMNKLFRDRDFYSFGKAMAPLIIKVEYLLLTAAWPEAEARRTGFPCRTYQEAWPLGVKAMRERGIPQEAYLADILDVKYLMSLGQEDESRAMAASLTEKHPNVPFFYYVASLREEDMQLGLQYAKKGLKCPGLTPYVRFNLLYCTLYNAFQISQDKLRFTSTASAQTITEGFAYARSSTEDAETYMREAPPDCRWLRPIIYIWIQNLLLLRGHELTLKSPELVEAKRRLKLADKTSLLLNQRLNRSFGRMTSLVFLERMDDAWAEWGPIVTEWQESVAVFESSPPPPVDVPNDDSEEGYLAWSERVNNAVAAEGSNGDDTSWRKAMEEVGKFTSAEWDSLVEMNRCAWCRTPSVVLKKCRGQCSTKYCDKTCQKQDWPSHKKVCEDYNGTI